MEFTRKNDNYYYVPIVALGKRLRDNFGLNVVEHPAFGGVTPGVHAKNSFHKYDEAIDVRDYRDDVIDGVDWKTRTGNLQSLLAGSGDEVIGPLSGDPNHATHLHLAAKDGMFKLDDAQYEALFGGKSGGQLATFVKSNLPHSHEDTQIPFVNNDSDIDSLKLQQEAVERVKQYQANTAKEVVQSFNNDFDQMKSQRLANSLKAAQEQIIQQRIDSGMDFGGKMVEITRPKKTTI